MSTPTPRTPAQSQPHCHGDVISRHLAGERVTNQYIDTQAGELSDVPLDEPVPPQNIPILGAVNTNEHPITEPGYRPTKLHRVEVVGQAERWLLARCAFEHGRPGCGVTIVDWFDGTPIICNDENAPCFELLSAPERAQIRAAISAYLPR